MAEANPSASVAGGLRASLQGMLSTLLAILQTRLELLSTEVEEEKRRLLATMAWGAVSILLGTVALAFLGLFITVLFWTTHRELVLGLLTLSFAAGGVWAFRKAARQLQASGQWLDATLAELQSDRQALSPVPSSSSTPAPTSAVEPTQPHGKDLL